MTEKPRETQAESHVVELKEKVNNSSLMKHPRSVLQLNETDYAWNLQVEPEILASLAAGGGGTVVSAFATLVERLMLKPNQSGCRSGRSSFPSMQTARTRICS